LTSCFSPPPVKLTPFLHKGFSLLFVSFRKPLLVREATSLSLLPALLLPIGIFSPPLRFHPLRGESLQIEPVFSLSLKTPPPFSSFRGYPGILLPGFFLLECTVFFPLLPPLTFLLFSGGNSFFSSPFPGGKSFQSPFRFHSLLFFLGHGRDLFFFLPVGSFFSPNYSPIFSFPPFCLHGVN